MLVDAGIGYRSPNRYGIVSLRSTNIFSQHFGFQKTYLRNPTKVPSSGFLAKLTLALP
jgi:hypothetical protein